MTQKKKPLKIRPRKLSKEELAVVDGGTVGGRGTLTGAGAARDVYQAVR